MPKASIAITFAQLRVGDVAGFAQKFSPKMVAGFAKLSGNYNPLHTDPVFAAKTEFKKPIAYGMQAGALFSRLLGMYLPGKYGICLSQTLSFHKPIYFNTKVSVEGKVLQKVESLHLAKIETKIFNSADNELLVSGEALVKLLK